MHLANKNDPPIKLSDSLDSEFYWINRHPPPIFMDLMQKLFTKFT